MKIAICSDLHLEFGELVLRNEQGAGVLVLAGDICVARDFELANKSLYAETKSVKRYLEFFEQVSRAFPEVIYIMGNHEHYNGDFAHTYTTLKQALAHLPNIRVLEKETIVLDDITFVCATAWTSMNDSDTATLSNIKRMMNDFRTIKNSNNQVTRRVPLYDNEKCETNEQGYVVRNVIGHKFKQEPSIFTPEDSVHDHKHAVDYINHVTAEKTDQKFVVITHHAPSRSSCHERFQHDTIMNGAFYSNLDDFIAYRPQIKLWVHGHTHDTFDYVIGETRVVCNPRGYVGYERRSQEFELVHVDI